MPLVPILIQAAVQVMTKPWLYVGIIGLFVASKFNLANFGDEAARTALKLWPYAVLWAFFLLALAVIRIKLGEQRKK